MPCRLTGIRSIVLVSQGFTRCCLLKSEADKLTVLPHTRKAYSREGSAERQTTMPPSKMSSVALVSVTQKTLGPKICSFIVFVHRLFRPQHAQESLKVFAQILLCHLACTCQANTSVQIRLQLVPNRRYIVFKTMTVLHTSMMCACEADRQYCLCKLSTTAAHTPGEHSPH